MLLLGSRKIFSASKVDVFPVVAYSWRSLFQRFSQDRHRPPGIEDFFCCQKLDRLASIAFFGVFRIQLYEFLVSSSFQAACTVERIREVVLEGGEQERPEFTFEPVNAAKCPVFQQVQEKTLSQVLGVIRRMSAAPSENVEWIPIEPAQLGQSGLPSLRLTLRRPHDDRPARGVKARRAFHWRTMVAFHEEVGLLPTVAGKSIFRNKIPETPEPCRLCNGMKTLIPDYDCELHARSTAKPSIRKLRIAAAISGVGGDDSGFRTLAGSAACNAELGARPLKRHDHHDLAEGNGATRSDLGMVRRNGWNAFYPAWSGRSIAREPIWRPAFDQLRRRPRPEDLRLPVKRWRAFP